MPTTAQSYSSHRRFFPPLHFFAVPVLLVNVIVTSMQWDGTDPMMSAWRILVAFTLMSVPFIARAMALTAQNRVIRLEERMRLGALMPDGTREKVSELTTGQLVGLRFASDAEAPELAEKCLGGELRTSGDVKKAIKTWRPDYLRV